MAIEVEQIQPWDGQSGTGSDARGVIDRNFEKVKTELEKKLEQEDLEDYAKTGGSEKTVKQVEDEIVQLAGEILDMSTGIADGKVNYKPKLNLTQSKYIASLGQHLTTASELWNATLDWIPTGGADQLHYKGLFGNSGTRIAFYRNPYLLTGSFISSYPTTDMDIKDEIIPIPVEARFWRGTFREPDVNGAEVVLIGYNISKEAQLFDFKIVGTPAYDENGVIQSGNIEWNDGSTGVVTYGDWNEHEFAYTSFVATSIENGKQVTQPPVTFDDNGFITNYPNFIITNI